MNLYRIKVLHGAPKDSHTSIETYLAAKSEEDVANWIEAAKCYGSWFTPSKFSDPEDVRICWSKKREEEISFKEYILENRGDLEDEEGWEDAYYGITKWGWEPMEATEEDIKRLVELEIAEYA
jgi:hypothetical protein